MMLSKVFRKGLRLLNVVVLSGGGASLAACSWVKPDEGAADVALVKAAHVRECKELGKIYANTTHTLAGLQRKRSKVADELVTLAKNEAYGMGGDTIVSLSAPENGEQRFVAYLCQH